MLYEGKTVMKQNIVLASDSTTDLNAQLIARYDLQILPLTVALGGKSYADGTEIDPDTIYCHYEQTKELPKTAAPNMADFYSFFEKHTADGSAVIFFTISAEMSSTYNNARLAAQSFENVYVVDTRNLSTGGGLLVVTAGEMIKAGKSAAEIAEYCKALTPKVSASFIVDDLEFLYKGGRCSAVAAIGANLLQLKPCITVHEGKMGVGKKYRGKFAAVLLKYIEDQLGDASSVELDHIFITHAGCDEAIYRACAEKVKAIAPDANVHITRAGCTISSHCGRNTLGVLFIRK